MRAPRDPFLAGFAAFARAEGEAHPAMADQMATLADALGRCTPLQPGPQPAHQVVEAHLGPGLDAAEVDAVLSRGVAYQHERRSPVGAT